MEYGLGEDLKSHIRRFEQRGKVNKEIYKVLAIKHKFDPDDRQVLRIWDTIEEEKTFRRIFTGFQIFLGIMGALTLMVAGAGVANINYGMYQASENKSSVYFHDGL